MSTTNRSGWIPDAEILDKLRAAANDVEGSLSKTKYRKLDDVPSGSLLRRRFGSWNGAKAAAGLEVTPSQAHGTGESPKQYYGRVRAAASCAECSEHTTTCLQFHHLDPDKKTFNIGSGVNSVESIAPLRDEMSKCAVLCSNCHRNHHASRHPFEATRKHRFTPPEPI